MKKIYLIFWICLLLVPVLAQQPDALKNKAGKYTFWVVNDNESLDKFIEFSKQHPDSMDLELLSIWGVGSKKFNELAAILSNQNKNLKYLYFNGCKIQASQLAQLLEAIQIKPLIHFRWENCGLIDEQLIPYLTKIKFQFQNTLKLLSFHGTPVEEKVFTEPVFNFPALEVLDLADCEINKKALLNFLKDSTVYPSLKKLYLQDNKFSSFKEETFFDGIPKNKFPSLELLNIQGAKMSYSDLTILLKVFNNHQKKNNLEIYSFFPKVYSQYDKRTCYFKYDERLDIDGLQVYFSLSKILSLGAKRSRGIYIPASSLETSGIKNKLIKNINALNIFYDTPESANLLLKKYQTYDSTDITLATDAFTMDELESVLTKLQNSPQVRNIYLVDITLNKPEIYDLRNRFQTSDKRIHCITHTFPLDITNRFYLPITPVIPQFQPPKINVKF